MLNSDLIKIVTFFVAIPEMFRSDQNANLSFDGINFEKAKNILVYTNPITFNDLAFINCSISNFNNFQNPLIKSNIISLIIEGTNITNTNQPFLEAEDCNLSLIGSKVISNFMPSSGSNKSMFNIKLGNVQIEKTRFENNSYDSLIFLNEGDLEVSRSDFINNSTFFIFKTNKVISTVFNGLIFANNSTPTNFTNKFSSLIDIRDTKEIIMNNCEFLSNKQDNLVNYSLLENSSAIFNELLFEDNEVRYRIFLREYNVNALNDVKTVLEWKNIIAKNNTFELFISIYSNTKTIKLDNLFFENNKGTGRLIDVPFSAKKFMLTNSNFKGNNHQVLEFRGAPEDSLLIENCVVEENNNYGTVIETGVNAIVKNCKFLGDATKIRSSSFFYQYNNTSALFVDGCIFTKYKFSSYGSAIFSAGNIFVTNSNFLENESTGGNGVAIRCHSKISIDNCTFTKNKSSSSGGAIYSYNSISVTNSNFLENESAGEGGAIMGVSNVNLGNCIFIKNKSNTTGGAIFLNGSISVTNSNFIENESISGNGGGAIYSRSKTNIDNCTFTKNKSKHVGGAIYSNNSISVTNSNFLENESTGRNGGAIYSSHKTSIDNCTFTKNKSNSNGGAIYSSDSISVTNSNFIENESISGNGGGAIYSSSKTSIDNCTFTKNKCSYSGGAINSSGSTSVTNSNFLENETTGNIGYPNGGAIYSSSKTSIDNCIFTKNKSSWSGGAIYSSDSISVIKSDFLKNSSGSYGGAIYCRKNFRVKSSNFLENSTIYSGAAINSYGTDCYIHDSYFFGNTTTSNNSGGIVYAYQKLFIENSVFEKNSSTSGYGGIVYSSNGVLSNCKFIGNESPILISGTSYIIENCSLINNKISDGLTTYGVFNNCLISGNSSKDLFVTSYAGDGSSLENTTVSGNYFSGRSNISKFNNSIFYNNSGSFQTSFNGKKIGSSSDSIYFSTATHSNIQGGYPGEGNTDLDPQFVDPENGDYRLKCTSPLINLGSNAEVSNVSVDLDGLERISDGTVDMGAYEFQGSLAEARILPQANFEFPSRICQGLDAPLNNTTPNTSKFSYVWSYKGKAPVSYQILDTLSAALEGPISVTLQASNGCGASDSITKILNVLPTSTPEIQYPTTACAGDTLDFTASEKTCANYSWSSTGGDLLSNTNTSSAKLYISPDQEGKIVQLTLNASNCGKTEACELPATINIPVVPTKPQISGLQEVCEYDTANYSIAEYQNIDGLFLSWSAVGAEILGESQGYNLSSVQLKMNANNPNAKLVVNTKHEILKCKGTDTLDINIAKKLKIQESTLLAKYCGEDSLKLSANNSGTFAWAVLGTGASNIHATTGKLIFGNEKTTVQVQVKNLVTGAFCNLLDTVTLIVKPKPIIDQIIGEQLVTPFKEYKYSFVSSSDSLVGGTTNNSKNTISSTGLSFDKVNITWAIPSLKEYSFKIINKWGCFSDVDTIQPKTDVINAIVGLNTVCADQTFTLSSSISNWSNPSYTWINGIDTILGTSTSPVYSFNQVGKKDIYLIVKNGGREYIAKHSVVVNAAFANLSITGNSILAPEGGGTNSYTLSSTESNESSFLYYASVQGGTLTSALPNKNISVVWNANGPYSINYWAKLPGEACLSAQKTFAVVKAPAFVPKISVGTGAFCANDEVEISIETDKYTKILDLTVIGNATITERNNTIAKLKIGNGVGDLKLSLEYERFGIRTKDTAISIVPNSNPIISKTPICGENAALVSASAGFSSYLWRSQPDNLVVSETFNFTSTLPKLYTLEVINNAGCKAKTSVQLEKIDYTAPEIFNNQSSNFCIKTEDKKSNFFTAYSPQYSYKWKVDGVEVTSTDATLEYDFSGKAIGTYKVELESSLKECKASATTVVSIYTCENGGVGVFDTSYQCKAPAINFVTTGCDFFSFAQTQGPSDQISWNFGDGTSATGANTSKKYNKIGVYEVYAKRLCQSWYQNVQVPLSVKFEATEQSCLGAAINFKDYSVWFPGVTILSYEWNYGDGNKKSGTGTDFSSAYTYTTAGTKTVTLSVKALDVFGVECTYSKHQTIKINYFPQVAFDITYPACGGNLYKFTNNTTQATVSANYTWTIADFTSNDKNLSYPFDASGTKNIILKVSDDFGCTSQLSKNITVAPIIAEAPLVSSVAKPYLCQGSTIKLTSPSNSTASYKWYKDNVLLSNNTKDLNATSTGAYKVIFNDGVCERSSLVYTLNGFFPSSIKPKNIDSLCQDTEVKFVPTTILAGVSYQWVLNGIKGVKTPNYSNYMSTTALQLGLILYDSSSTCSYSSATKNFLASPLPNAPVVGLEATEICSEDSLKGTISNFNPLFVYQMKIGLITSKNITSGSFSSNALAIGDNNIGIFITDNKGCKRQYSNNVNKASKITFTASLDKISLCENQPLKLNATISEASNVTVQWSSIVKNIVLGSGLNQTIAKTPTSLQGGIKSKVVFSDWRSKCLAPEIALNLDVFPSPKTPLIFGDSVICEGNELVLSTDALSNFKWNNQFTTNSINVLKSGVYTVKETNPINNCSASKSIRVRIFKNPDLSFVGTGVYEVCGNQAFPFKGLDNMAYYQWSLNGNDYGKPNIALIPRISGSYEVRATTLEGCSATSKILRLTSYPCGACIVTTELDGTGIGSLRDAIECANTKKGNDAILFELTGTAPFVFKLNSELPKITEGLTIDASSVKGVYPIQIDANAKAKNLFTFGIGRISDFTMIGLQSYGFDNVLKSDGFLDNALIDNNSFLNNDTCLNVKGTTRNLGVLNNSFEQGLAIYSKGDAASLIQNNSFRSNSRAILSENSSNLIIKGNYFTANSDTSLSLKNTQNAFITTNNFGKNLAGTISSNLAPDLKITGTAHVQQNNFHESKSNGIIIESNGFVEKNNFYALNSDALVLNSEKNVLTQNLFFDTKAGVKAIQLNGLGNTNKLNTGIDTAIYGKSRVLITGKGLPNDLVELFRATKANQTAMKFVGTAKVLADGTWSYTLRDGQDYTVSDTTYYTNTLRDNLGNTSELGKPIRILPFECSFVVKNTNNDGKESFRRAVACANTDLLKDVITFDLSASSSKEIKLLSSVVVTFPVDVLGNNTNTPVIKPVINATFVFDTLAQKSTISFVNFDGTNAVNYTAIQLNKTNDIVFSNLTFNKLATAINLGTTQKYDLKNSTFTALTSLPLLIANTGSGDVKIEGNTISQNSFPFVLGAPLGTKTSFVFSGNTVYDNYASTAIWVNGPNIILKNNKFGTDELGASGLSNKNNLIENKPAFILNGFSFTNNQVAHTTTALQLKGDEIQILNNRFGQFKNGKDFQMGTSISGSGDFEIKGNLFVNHQASAIKIVDDLVNYKRLIIQNNQFGIDSAHVSKPNFTAIELVMPNANSISVKNNVIVSNTNNALIVGAGDKSIQIDSNLVGIDKRGILFPNLSDAVYLTGAKMAINPIVFKRNTVVSTVGNAVLVNGFHNLITENKIYGNSFGIKHVLPNGNNRNPAPEFTETIATYKELTIKGTSSPNDTIELFESDLLSENAYTFFVKVKADASGNWKYTFDNIRKEYDFIATATDAVGNTSQFSKPYNIEPYLCSNIIANTQDNGNGSLRRAVECTYYLYKDLEVNIVGNTDNEVRLKSQLPNFFADAKALKLTGADKEGNKFIIAGDGTFNGIDIRNVSLFDVQFKNFDTILSFVGDKNLIRNTSFEKFNIGVEATKGFLNEATFSSFEDGKIALKLNNQGTGNFSSLSFATQKPVEKAIFVQKSNYLNFNNNTVGIYSSKTPISLQDVKYSSFYGLNSNLKPDIETAIKCDNCAFSRFYGSTFKGGQYGIRVDHSEENFISENNFENLSKEAVFVANSDFIQLNKITTKGLMKDNKIINLNYGTPQQSNMGYASPSFETATYKSKKIYIRGKAMPFDTVQIYQTEGDSSNLKNFYANIVANNVGVFSFEYPVTLLNFNDLTFNAFSIQDKNRISNPKLYSRSSELSGPFNPNLKICFVTSESDNNVKGTLRYNIDLANAEKCNLMLFEVSGKQTVNISPLSYYADIKAPELTIDATSQPSYLDSPVVFLSKTSTLNYGLAANGDTSKLYIHGLGINDFDTSVVLKNSRIFEQSLSSFNNYLHPIGFKDSTVEYIQLEQNSFRSQRADYGMNTTVPNIILKNNFFNAGTKGALIVNSDSLLTDGNTYDRDMKFNGKAVEVRKHNNIFLTNDIAKKYAIGFYADSMGVYEMRNNKVYESDTAFVIKNDTIGVLKDNFVATAKLGYHVYNSKNTLLEGNKAGFVNTKGIAIINDTAFVTKGFLIDSSSKVVLKNNQVTNSYVSYDFYKSRANTLMGNTSLYHKSMGIFLDSLSGKNQLYSNKIGFYPYKDVDDSLSLSYGQGMYILSDSNIIGAKNREPNYVGYNTFGGINVKGKNNSITYNTLAKNDLQYGVANYYAIEHLDSIGNAFKKSPEISSYKSIVAGKVYLVHGRSEPKDTIHIYNSNGYYQSAFGAVGVAVANDTGYWETNVERAKSLYLDNYATLTLVATATDSVNNTSMLSNMIYVGDCYVTNSKDDTHNDFPIPNSLRQAVACVNSLPEVGKVLVANKDEKYVRLRRQMIPLQTKLGATVDGNNLAISGNRLGISQFFDDSTDVKVNRDSVTYVALPKTNVGWIIDTSFGGSSTIKNLKFESVDTMFQVKTAKGLVFDDLKMSSINDKGIAILLDTAVKNIQISKLSTAFSYKATAVYVSERDSNIAISYADLKEMNYGLIVKNAKDVHLNTSIIKTTKKPVFVSGSDKIELSKNQFELEKAMLLFEDNKNLNITGNKFDKIDSTSAILIQRQNTSIIKSNTFEGEFNNALTIKNAKFIDVLSNKAEEVENSFIDISNSDSSSVKSNGVKNFLNYGIIANNTSNLLISENIFEKSDTLTYKGIININKNVNGIASNNSKEEPKILSHGPDRRSTDCKKEKLGIYIYGKAAPNDVIEVFSSELKPNTHAKYLGKDTADASGDWSFRIPNELYTMDIKEKFAFSATGTENERVTSQESNKYVYNGVYNPLVVVNTNNTGTGSLRKAFKDINCSDIYNVVTFNIDAEGPHEIEVKDSLLPVLKTYLGYFLNGKSQNDFVKAKKWNSEVVINNVNFPDSAAIRSEGAKVAFFDSLTIFSQKGLEVNENSPEIINFTFTNPETTNRANSWAVQLDSTSSSIISGSKISGYQKGIVQNFVTDTKLTQNEIQKTTVGISLVNESNLVIIEENKIYSDSIGVLVKNCSNTNVITKNEFAPLGSSLTNAAVSIENSNQQLVVKNYIPNAKTILTDTTMGVFLISGTSSDNKIIQNILGFDSLSLNATASNLIGVLISASGNNAKNNTIQENQFVGLEVPAIYVNNDNGTVITKNAIGIDEKEFQVFGQDNYAKASGIKGNAILLENALNSKISQNKIINYTEFGINAKSSEGIQITSNKIFSDLDTNKAIELNKGTAFESNKGIEKPEITSNEIVDKTTIKVKGTSLHKNSEIYFYQVNKDKKDSLLTQSLRFITAVPTNSNGDWEVGVPTSNFGFTDFNTFTAQALVASKSSSEYSTPYRAKTNLCNLKGKNVDFFSALYEPCSASDFSVEVPISGVNYSYTFTKTKLPTITKQKAQIDTSDVVDFEMKDNSTCSFKETFEVKFKPKPEQPNFVVTKDVNLGDTIVVVDISKSIITSYDWSIKGVGVIIDQTSAFVKIVPEDTGRYQVTQRSLRNGCFVSLTKDIKVGEGKGGNILEFNAKNNSLAAYPNPITIGQSVRNKVTTATKEECTVSLITLTGTVKNEIKLIGQTSYDVVFPIPANFVAGVYIIRLQTPSTVINQSIIIQ